MEPTSTSFPYKLLDGYREFKANRFVDQKGKYEALAEEGQKPETLMIACCDSRAAPEIIFNSSVSMAFNRINLYYCILFILAPHEASLFSSFS